MSMNGYSNHDLDDDNFGPAGGISALRSFDAFPKTKTTYLTRTRNGTLYTVVLILACVWLTSTEVYRWVVGTTTHMFSVEKGVEHNLRMNIDIIVAMPCNDLHVNVQDAAGDRILAGEKLKKDNTLWSVWDDSYVEARSHANDWESDQRKQYLHEDDVHEFLAKTRGRRTFKRTPNIPRGREANACRIYGTLDGNKVQGDFHITARGHGYAEMGDHLNHKSFNFSHHINELSFGPFFPSLQNPLDDTQDTTELHFFKYQYYLSIVPTIYTDTPHYLDDTTQPRLGDKSKRPNPYAFPPHTLFTNQYAVTEQSHAVAESAVPGIFVKYDIEPILLTVSEEWGGLLGLIVKVVNVIAGVMVAGTWLVSLGEWAADSGFLGRALRNRSASSAGGLLHGGKMGVD